MIENIIMADTNHIRNFVIIAHVDHGKSTLADRLLEITGTIEKREMRPQFLDQLELERRRGITIKMAPVRMIYRPSEQQGIYDKEQGTHCHKSQVTSQLSSNSSYILNLIDTPGHSDFSYEVSRALRAVEGAILLVDGTQGIQAQTLVNFEHAKKAGLTIIGAVNKIDLNPPLLEESIDDLHALLGIPKEKIFRVSGKTGIGVSELLEAVIDQVPAPQVTGDKNMPARALIFDSLYDEHRGVIAFVRVINGEFRGEQMIRLAARGIAAKIKKVGYFFPMLKDTDVIREGEIGFIATGLKDPAELKIGDTVLANSRLQIANSRSLILPGYQEPQSVLFVSFYPEDADEYDDLKKAILKLKLTDAALTLEPDFNEVLGRGFKIGFLGKLHFEVTAERLEGEFEIAVTQTFPSVSYQVETKKGWETIQNPKDWPQEVLSAKEPYTMIEILSPLQYVGQILELKNIFRISDITNETIGNKIIIRARLPLSELIQDFDDRLKTVSHGYASLSYEIQGYETADLEKMDVLVAGHIVPGLTRILPKEDIEREARKTVEKLKNLLPQQQFTQAIQASAMGRIIARETIAALRKELGNFGKTGGDRTRKMKLWKKQQRGKRALQERGETSSLKLSPSVFKELLKKGT